MTVRLGILAQLEAVPGKGAELAAFLQAGRELAVAEQGKQPEFHGHANLLSLRNRNAEMSVRVRTGLTLVLKNHCDERRSSSRGSHRRRASRPSVPLGGGSNSFEQPVKILDTWPARPQVGTNPGIDKFGVLTNGHHVGVDMQDGHCLVATHILRVCLEEPLQFRPLRHGVSTASI